MDDALGVKDWIFNEAIAMKLVAIDFEMADQSADSACAIGIVSPTCRLSQPSVKFGISLYLFGRMRTISWHTMPHSTEKS